MSTILKRAFLNKEINNIFDIFEINEIISWSIMTGVRIWHIVKGKLIEIKSAIFANGDTYIVEDQRNKILWIWIGSKSTIDEKFAAAQISQNELIPNHMDYEIKSIEEGNEPGEFLDIFGTAIKFVEGDVHTLLKHKEK